jgi:hypothetical protein
MKSSLLDRKMKSSMEGSCPFMEQVRNAPANVHRPPWSKLEMLQLTFKDLHGAT